jgi:DNA-binding MarR family transcriptional regulator
MGLARQTVQKLVNEMESGGLLRFAPNPHHRRAQLVLFTDGGRAAYEAARQRQQPWAQALADGLAPEEIEQATALMRTLRQRLEAGDDT